MHAMSEYRHLPGWLLANAMITVPAAIAWGLDAYAGEFYYRVIQEDHWMEWSTVWAFLGAGVAAILGARWQRKALALIRLYLCHR